MPDAGAGLRQTQPTSTTPRAPGTTLASSPTTATRALPTPSSRSRSASRTRCTSSTTRRPTVSASRRTSRTPRSHWIKVAGFASFDPKASSYEALYNNIKATGADAVFIGGLICENGAQLIKDKVAVLGPNTGVKLLTPDGFALQGTIDDAGSASAGMYMSVAGQPIDKFQGEG